MNVSDLLFGALETYIGHSFLNTILMLQSFTRQKRKYTSLYQGSRKLEDVEASNFQFKSRSWRS